MNNGIKILFVDDAEEDALLAIHELKNADIAFTYKLVNNEKSFTESLSSFKPNLIISDYSMPQFDGMTALKIKKELDIDIPFILFTGSINELTAVECMKAGADDFILKDHLNRLSFSVKNVLENVAIKKEKALIDNSLRQSETRYRTLFEKARDGILVLDLNGGILDLNSSFAEMHGYTVDELKKIGLRDIDPNITPEFWENTMKIMLAEGSAQIEVQHYHKNGTLRTFDVIANIIEIAGEKYNMAFHRDITDRKEGEKILIESEEKFSKIFHNSPDVILISSIQDGFIFDVNEKIFELVGYDRKEIIGNSTVQMNLWADETAREKYISIIKGKGSASNFEAIFKAKNGSIKYTIVSGEFIELTGEKYLLTVIRDISERKKAEQEIIKINRLYQLISHVNELVLKSTDRDEIFKNVCQIAVEQGKFRMAWIGLYDETTDSIKPVKWHGYENGFFKTIDNLAKDLTFQIGPTSKAIHSSHYVFVNDIANDSLMPLARKNEALKRNYHSSIALPIFVKGKPIAVFVIYSSETFFFTEQEIKLLEEVAENISYSLDNILIREMQMKSAEEIRNSKERYDMVTKATQDMIWDIDFANHKIYRDGNFLAMGFPLNDLFNEDIWGTILHPEDLDRVLKKYDRVVFHSKGTIWKDEYRCIKANGEIAYVQDKGFIIRNENKKPVRMVGAMTDITERKRAEENVLALNLQLHKSIKNITDYKYAIDQSTIVSITNAEGEITYVNDNFLKISKYYVKELVGQNHRIINSGVHPKDFFNNLWATILKGNVWRGTTCNRAKDGSYFWTDNTIVPFLDEKGKPYQYVSLRKDITEQKEIERQKNESHDQLRQLASHLQEIREEERFEMAREIHDELGQQLTVLKMDISFLQNKIPAENKEANKLMKNTLVMIDQTIKTVRKISSNLRPSILDDLGLVEALQWYCQEFGIRSSIKTEFISSLTEIELPANYSIALFRIIQESLTNVARYSKAKKVIVTLQKTNDQLELKVIDNGKGFDLNAIKAKKTLGLVGINERTLMMNGNLEIITAPGKGTTNIVTIPL